MRSLYDALNVPDPAKPNAEPVDPILELTGKKFSKAVVESRQYRESIIRRIITDTLPPAVECRLLDHALGKPVERIEVSDTTPLEAKSAATLRERALQLAERAQRLQEAKESQMVH
jgi:hypothetical protein